MIKMQISCFRYIYVSEKRQKNHKIRLLLKTLLVYFGQQSKQTEYIGKYEKESISDSAEVCQV